MRSAIYEELQVCDLYHRVDYIVFVTAGGQANIVVAFEFHTQLDSVAHVLDTTLEHSARVAMEGKNQEVHSIISACSLLVMISKCSDLQFSLKTSFKAHVETRWNGKYYMFCSIHEQWGHICSLLQGENEANRMADISKALCNR